MSLDDHLAVPLVRRDPGPEAGEGGQEPAEAADHRGGGPLCEVEVQVQCSGVWCVPPGVPAPTDHCRPVVAHSYTRTGTPAHWHTRGTSSASQPGHSAQLTDETAANMNISSDMLHMIRTSLHCPVYRVSRVLSNNQHPVLY